MQLDNLGRRLEARVYLPPIDLVVYDAHGKTVQSFYSQKKFGEALISRALVLKHAVGGMQ